MGIDQNGLIVDIYNGNNFVIFFGLGFTGGKDGK
jgi:hypothetical protein